MKAWRRCSFLLGVVLITATAAVSEPSLPAARRALDAQCPARCLQLLGGGQSAEARLLRLEALIQSQRDARPLLRALEQTDRRRFTPDQLVRFYLARARLTHSNLRRRNIEAAFASAKTPLQRCRVRIADARLQSIFERGEQEALSQAVELYRASPRPDPLCEADLATMEASLANSQGRLDDAWMHSLHALQLASGARLWGQVLYTELGLAGGDLREHREAAAVARIRKAVGVARHTNEPSHWLLLGRFQLELAEQHQKWPLPPLRPAIADLCARAVWEALHGQDFKLAEHLAAQGKDLEIQRQVFELERELPMGSSSPSLYARALPVVTNLQREIEGTAPSPLADWEDWMSRVEQGRGHLGEAEDRARRAVAAAAFWEQPRYQSQLLTLELAAGQNIPAAEATRTYRVMAARLESPNERAQAFIRLYNALRNGSSQNRDESAQGDGIAATSDAGRLWAECLADRGYVEQALRDLDASVAGAITVDREAQFEGYRTRLLAMTGHLREAIDASERMEERLEAHGRRVSAGAELANLGRLNYQNGQHQAAFAAYRKASELLADEPAQQAWLALDPLARLLRNDGRLDESVQVARQAVALVAREPAWLQLQCLSGLGHSLVASGAAKDGAEVFGRAVEVAETEDDRQQMRALQAWSCKKAGDTERAIELMRVACEYQVRTRDYLALAGNLDGLCRWLKQTGHPDEAARWLESCAQGIVELRVESPRFSEEQMAALRTVVEPLIALLLAQHREGEAATWVQRLRSVEALQAVNRAGEDEVPKARSQLAFLQGELQKAPGQVQRQQLEQQLAEERRHFVSLLESLRSRYSDYDQLAALRVSQVPQLQDNLPDDAFALQFFAEPDGVWLLGVARNRRVTHFTPVPRARLDEVARELLERISDHRDASAAASQLGQWLLEPMVDYWRGRKLLVLPSGSLSALPLDALEVGGKPVLDQAEVCGLFSADVTRLAPARARHLVAVGAPTGADLPGAVEELESLRKLRPQGTFLTGDGARLAAVMEAAPRADILHISTHAHTQPASPQNDTLQLSDQPLGMADIEGLPLKRGSLVVLSACQTGRTRQLAASDLNSLAGAFRSAGAGTVIASLWPVDDDATRELIGDFYTHLATGEPAAAALCETKRSFRRKHADPNLWASLQITGQDW